MCHFILAFTVTNSIIFLYTLGTVWLMAVLMARRAGGEGGAAPLTWHPAGWFCEGIALGRGGGKFTAGLLFVVGAVALGGGGVIGEIVSLGILAPLPYLLVDYCRRDSKVRRTKRVFFNPLHAVTSQPYRSLTKGRVDESVMKLYFCIDDAEWTGLKQVMSDPVREYLERRRIGGPIFEGEADNDFLQVYDSLGLSRFLIEPSNERIIQALVTAATGADVARVDGSAPDGGGDERIVTAGAALGVDGGTYLKNAKRQAPTGKARSVPIAPPPNLGGEEEEEDNGQN